MMETRRDVLGPIDRRTFLRGTMVGAAAIACAGLLPSGCGGYPVVPGLHALTAKEFAVLQSLADVFTSGLPDGAPTARELNVAGYLDRFFAGEAPAVQTQLKRALLLIEYGGYVWGRPRGRFTRMPPGAQTAYVARLSATEPGVRRAAIETFRRACLNAYYSDERTWESVGYDGPFV